MYNLNHAKLSSQKLVANGHVSASKHTSSPGEKKADDRLEKSTSSFRIDDILVKTKQPTEDLKQLTSRDYQQSQAKQNNPLMAMCNYFTPMMMNKNLNPQLNPDIISLLYNGR